MLSLWKEEGSAADFVTDVTEGRRKKEEERDLHDVRLISSNSSRCGTV